jgi:hypothetical protein
MAIFSPSVPRHSARARRQGAYQKIADALVSGPLAGSTPDAIAYPTPDGMALDATAYPIPDVVAPDAIAYPIPDVVAPSPVPFVDPEATSGFVPSLDKVVVRPARTEPDETRSGEVHNPDEARCGQFGRFDGSLLREEATPSSQFVAVRNDVAMRFSALAALSDLAASFSWNHL